MSFFPLAGPGGPLTGLERPQPPALSELPLVLVHGIQGTARSWQGAMEKVPATVTALAPNLRGRGGSVVPEQATAYAMEAFAADLEAVLTAIGRPVVLAGWSMGVLVSLAYIQRYGLGRVRALALISGTAHPGEDARWFSGEDVAAISAEAEQRARNLKLVESAAPVAVAGAWLSARQADYRDVLPRIDVPTLVIHGSDDDQCPLEHGRVLAKGIPDSRLTVYEQGGHNLLAESPDALMAELTALRAGQLTPG